MSLSSGISVQDSTDDEGQHIRWANTGTTSTLASISISPTATVNQVVVRGRQPSTGTAVMALYSDGAKVGTFTPPKGSTMGTVTVTLTSPIAAGTHTFAIGPNANLANFVIVDWFELHNTGSTGGDTTPPAAPTITGGPAGGGTDSDGNVSFSFTGAESGGTFECSNVPQGQAANYSACTSPKPYSGLANGSYTFSVRQKDAAGNVGAAATRNYSVSISTPPPGGSARLVGAGDIATSGSMDTATGDLIDARTNARVFTAGDNAYLDGAASDFTNKYHPAWGPFKNRTSPSPGNHEYHTSGASGYMNYFGSVAGLRSVNPTYYAYTLGAWRVYALDSNISMAIGSPQYNFVQNDLASNGALCELAYWHHPIASSGQHGNIAVARPIFALFDAQGGDLVLNGHDHNYERFTKIDSLGRPSASGVRQIIVGTGGTGLRSLGFVQPGSEVRNSTTHGIVDINLSSTGYSGTFVPVPGKTFTDSFSGTCGTT
jgi:hypothetical protein